jgi:hypothetical protein
VTADVRGLYHADGSGSAGVVALSSAAACAGGLNVVDRDFNARQWRRRGARPGGFGGDGGLPAT